MLDVARGNHQPGNGVQRVSALETRGKGEGKEITNEGIKTTKESNKKTAN